MRSSAISFRCLPSLPPHDETLIPSEQQRQELPGTSAKLRGSHRRKTSMANLVGDGLLHPASPLQESCGPSNPWNDMDSHASLVEEFDLYGALMAKLGDKRKLQVEDETPGASYLTKSLANLTVHTSISTTTDGVLERSLHNGYVLSAGDDRVISDNDLPKNLQSKINSVGQVIIPQRPDSLEASYSFQPLGGTTTSTVSCAKG